MSALGALQKAVFSQPTEGAAYSRVTVRPVRLKGQTLYQLEGLRDNKAYHRNLSETALERKPMKGLKRFRISSTSTVRDRTMQTCGRIRLSIRTPPLRSALPSRLRSPRIRQPV